MRRGGGGSGKRRGGGLGRDEVRKGEMGVGVGGEVG